MCVCMYTYIFKYVYTCTYIYVYTYSCMYIYIYIDVCAQNVTFFVFFFSRAIATIGRHVSTTTTTMQSEFRGRGIVQLAKKNGDIINSPRKTGILSTTRSTPPIGGLKRARTCPLARNRTKLARSLGNPERRGTGEKFSDWPTGL